MTENIENIRIDEVLDEYFHLREENKKLREELTHFKAKSLSLSKRCRELSVKNHDLETEIADMRFTWEYLTAEEAGRKFARKLIGGA